MNRQRRGAVGDELTRPRTDSAARSAPKGKTMRRFHTMLLIGAGLSAPAAHAARAIDAPPPTRAAVLNAPRPDPAAQADDASSLRQGLVAEVNAKGDAVLINGSWLAVADGRTVLFQRGRSVPASALNKGQVVKFTLAPGVADRKTLGVVYVP
jgi:hypothetical protein